MTLYPIRQPHAVRHPITGEFVVPRPGEPYDDDDVLVKAHRWLFVTADELEDANSREIVDSVDVEQATRAPGEKRATRRTKK